MNLSHVTLRSDALQLLDRDGKKDTQKETRKIHTTQLNESFNTHVLYIHIMEQLQT